MNDEKLPTVIEPSKGLCKTDREFKALELAARYAFASQYKPKHIQNSSDCMAVVLYGREIGVPPMEALKSVHCMEGKFELDYTLVLALIYRNFPGTIFKWLTPIENRKKECFVQCISPQRGEQMAMVKIEEFRYISEKQRDPNKSPWRRHPERMLMAKAVKLIADMMFADVVSGGPKAGGPLLSDTEDTLEETEQKEFKAKPVHRTDTLTDEERASKTEQLEKLKEIDENEQDARDMEAQWAKESPQTTLQ